MWYYGGMDVPFVDPTLINNNFGLGTANYGLTTPFFGTPKMTWGDVNFDGRLEVLPLGGLPYYGTSHLGFNPFVNSFINPLYKTTTTPYFGLNNILPTTWGTPIGFDKLGFNKMSWGYNPFFTNGTFGYSPMEELYKSTLGWTLPFNQIHPFTNTLGLYNTPYSFSGINPFTNTLGLYNTPYGLSNINPFFFNGIEDKIKFQTPFTTSSYGLYNTLNTFNTPIDWNWKLKTFGTPVGMTTETWNKPLGFPWKSNLISGPVAVL
jgi:hypothetical protein